MRKAHEKEKSQSFDNYTGGCACFYICIFMDTWISDYKVHSKARVRIITEGLDIAMLHWMAT